MDGLVNILLNVDHFLQYAYFVPTNLREIPIYTRSIKVKKKNRCFRFQKWFIFLYQ